MNMLKRVLLRCAELGAVKEAGYIQVCFCLCARFLPKIELAAYDCMSAPGFPWNLHGAALASPVPGFVLHW